MAKQIPFHKHGQTEILTSFPLFLAKLRVPDVLQRTEVKVMVRLRGILTVWWESERSFLYMRKRKGGLFLQIEQLGCTGMECS